MAWGYWNAHSLTPTRTSRPRSLSPAPPVRSRDHSLDRPSIGKICQTPEVARCPPGPQEPGGGCPVSNHVSPGHREYDIREIGPSWSERPDRTKDRDRNTLPRVKMESEGEVGPGEQRHTLPRGRTECEGQAWAETHSLPQSQGKTSSEGDWCPGCNSGGVSNISSRVSFHSVKDSSSAGAPTATSSDQGDKELLSSSLPTPPPPPFQKLCNCGALPGSCLPPDPGPPHPHLHGGHNHETAPPLQGVLTHRDRHVHGSKHTCRRINKHKEERELQHDIQARKSGSVRDSCSSRESHKSSVSQRSSQEEAAQDTIRRSETPEDRRRSGSLKQKIHCHTRTPSGEQEKFGSKSLDSGRASQSHGSRSHRSGEEINSEESRTPKSRGSGSFAASEDLRFCKHESSGSPDDKEKKHVSLYPLSRLSSQGRDLHDPDDWGDSRDKHERHTDKDTIKRRHQEVVRPNGAEILSTDRTELRGTELRGTTGPSRADSGVSPPHRSLRSITPDDGDDSTSFHETFERELTRNRRSRRRSASCSSRCCESHGQGRCGRLDSGHSTHSVTGASSRNSSSRSEKSSTRSERSSRSPSIEYIKQGCNSSQCRARTSLR
eukprot:TRINITY_DN40615_c0_g1_i1.p1 TRINITY_DN40615_c0_g1~~TRINITY_DN40615_c0_g1_i1.p1  ORF type:complete len:605 (-),score=107.43 TRINITY_DN40615_c0_g1_i1:689-2503(-)